MDIAIYGAGGFGRETACLIQRLNKAGEEWKFVGFFDDALSPGIQNEYGEVLGDIATLNSWPTPLAVAFGIGNPQVVSSIHSKITNSNIFYPNLLDPQIIWLDRKNVKIGFGNVVCANCFISCNVTIGNFNTINNGVSLGHDCSMGDYNALMPSCRISGGVEIGNRNFIGVNAVILQYHKLTQDIVIGASALVNHDINQPGTYVGVPVRRLS